MTFDATKSGTILNQPGRLLSCSTPQEQARMKYLNSYIFGAQFYLSAAEILALDSVPITLLTAPGSGLSLVIDHIVAELYYTDTGPYAINASDGAQIGFKYTDGSGTELARLEGVGFLDQTTSQKRIIYPYRAASGDSQVTPTENAAIVASLDFPVTAGVSPILGQIFYRIIRTTLEGLVPSSL